MAKKPAPLPTQPPPSSSSSSEEEEEDSSSDEEQTNGIKLDPQKTLTKKQESESESEESSDEEEEDEDEDQKLRPVNSTPSKPEPEPESEKIATPSRPIPEKSSRKSPFARLWSLDDEITILEAMVDYQSKHGPIKLTTVGVKDFHESVQKSLSIDVGIAKLASKMRSLWKKYTDANKKSDKIKFAKPHSKTIYELSKKVWGKDDDDDGFEVEALNGDSSGVTVNKGKSLKREFPFIRDALGGNRLALEKLEKVNVEKAAVLEKKFKKLKLEEINLTRKAYKMVWKEAEKLLN